MRNEVEEMSARRGDDGVKKPRRRRRRRRRKRRRRRTWSWWKRTEVWLWMVEMVEGEGR